MTQREQVIERGMKSFIEVGTAPPEDPRREALSRGVGAESYQRWPEWTTREIGEEFGLSAATVWRALQP